MRSSDESDNAFSRQLRVILDTCIFLVRKFRIFSTDQEQDHLKDQERGRRLVDALKKTSIAVQASHLIVESGDGCDHYLEAQRDARYQIRHLYDDVPNDTEMGRAFYCQNNGNVGAAADTESNDNDENAPKSKQSCLDNKPGDESKSVKKRTEVFEEEPTATTESTTSLSSPPLATEQESCQPQDVSNNYCPTSQNTILSMYPPQQCSRKNVALGKEEEEESRDIDGEDKHYTLRLPHMDFVGPNPSGPLLCPPARSRTKTCDVPGSCAICLERYRPGCIVSWSSNNECQHVFHRDCILLWLLEKEKWECPCCRGEFVRESVVDGNEGKGRNEVGSGASGLHAQEPDDVLAQSSR